MVRPPVLAGELSLSCARLTAGHFVYRLAKRDHDLLGAGFSDRKRIRGVLYMRRDVQIDVLPYLFKWFI